MFEFLKLVLVFILFSALSCCSKKAKEVPGKSAEKSKLSHQFCSIEQRSIDDFHDDNPKERMYYTYSKEIVNGNVQHLYRLDSIYIRDKNRMSYTSDKNVAATTMKFTMNSDRGMLEQFLCKTDDLSDVLFEDFYQVKDSINLSYEKDKILVYECISKSSEDYVIFYSEKIGLLFNYDKSIGRGSFLQDHPNITISDRLFLFLLLNKGAHST